VLRVAGDGTLSEVAGSPFGGTEPLLAVTATKRGSRFFVYATESSEDQVRAFQLQPDDTLAEVTGSPFAAGDNPGSLTAAGSRLLVAGFLKSEVRAFTISTSTGALTPAQGTPFAVAGLALQVYASPNGKQAYVPHGVDPEVAGFSVKKKGAALTPLGSSPFACGITTGNAGLALSSKKLVFAVAETGLALPNAQAMRRNKKGALTPLGAPQYLGMDGVWGAAFDPTGAFLASWSGFANEVRVHAVAADGTLTPVETESMPLNETLITGSAFVQP
jgi:6-phosphogluconolactonase (cycloisomerase 2 family)